MLTSIRSGDGDGDGDGNGNGDRDGRREAVAGAVNGYAGPPHKSRMHPSDGGELTVRDRRRIFGWWRGGEPS